MHPLTETVVAGALEAAGNLADARLHRQIVFAKQVRSVYTGTMGLVKKSLRPEMKSLDNDWIALYTDLQLHVKLLASELLGKDLKDLCVVKGDGDIGHLDVLDGLHADAWQWGEQVMDYAKATMQEFAQPWASTLDSETKQAIEQSGPAGWEKVKDSILPDEEEEVIAIRDALLNNPHYKGLGSTVSRLEANVKLAKKLNQVHPYIDPSLAKNASCAVTGGTETVAITYAIWVVQKRLPDIKHLTTRRDEIDKLEAKIKGNGLLLGESLKARCDMLLRAPKRQREAEGDAKTDGAETQQATPMAIAPSMGKS